MGWVRTLWKIYTDHIRVQWANFLLEVIWAVFNIAVTIILWHTVVRYVPGGWTEDMLFTFALFLELWVSITGLMKDISWAIIDIFLFGLSHLLSKPRPLLLAYMESFNAGEITALILKLVLFIPILLFLWKRPLEVLLATVILVLVTVGTELFFASVSAIFHSKGALWKLFYNLEWRLTVIPGDLFRGPLRFFVVAIIPAYVAVTFPTKLIAGISSALPLMFCISLIWLILGVMTTKKVIENVEAYGG